MRKYFVICLSLMLVLGTLSLATGFLNVYEEKHINIDEGAEYRDKEIQDESSEKVEVLSEKIQNEISSRSEDEMIEVMIRLSPHEFDDKELLRTPLGEVDTALITLELKEHSERKQSEVIDFIDRGNGEVHNTFWIANAILAEIEVGALDELMKFDQIWKIHENFEVEINHQNSQNFPANDELGFQSVQTDNTTEDLTWGLDRINVSEVWRGGKIWEGGFNGTDVRVAVSDTGVNIEHPDIEGKLRTVDADDPHYPGGWIEIDREGEIVQDSTPHEQHRGHGTHVSGTVVGGNASGTNIGVAPGVDLMHVGMFSERYPVCSQLLATLEWKLEPRDRHGDRLDEVYGGDIEDYRPHVASMSWGGDYEEYRSEFEEPIRNLRSAGIMPVTSMGNNGEGTIGTPGSIYEDISVGASDPDDNIAAFSSGDIVEDGREETPESYVKPDLAAPGVEIESTFHGGWEYISGTSMATPHVAGTAALMLDANPELTVDEIYKALKISADYNEAGESLFQERKNTRYGHGIINADKAVDYVSGLGIREPEYLTNEEAHLKAEVVDMPDDMDEFEVFFRYREKGEEEWLSTEPILISQPQEFRVELEDLNKGTSYEYKAVAQGNDSEETTFPLKFTTHRDVEPLTWPAENITSSSATLKGEVTHLYREEADVFFRYRRSGESEWSETELVTTDQPIGFKREIEDLDYNTAYEYKIIGISEGDEFIGDLMGFTTSLPKPEWDEEESVYQVSNTGELQWIKNDLTSDYILENNINASESKSWYREKGFEPIGTSDIPFSGTFNGNGYHIENLYINRSHTDDVGLFSSLGEEGNLKNIWINDVEIKGGGGVGGIVGVNSGTVEKSFATGNLSGEASNGGLVGINKGLISNSYAMVEIEGESYVGGLVGRVVGGTISSSYSIGNLNGKSHVGGLVGSNWHSGTVENSFWNIDTSEIEESDGGTGKTAEEMRDVATYTDTTTEGLDEPWDFVNDPYDDQGDENIWNIDDYQEINDGYPFLDLVEYELEINIEGEGSTEPEEGIHVYEHGEEVTITVEPKEGWQFVNWTGDIESEEDNITITIEDDMEITAVFEEEKVETPGFTTMLLLLGIFTAVVFNKKHNRSNN